KPAALRRFQQASSRRNESPPEKTPAAGAASEGMTTGPTGSTRSVEQFCEGQDAFYVHFFELGRVPVHLRDRELLAQLVAVAVVLLAAWLQAAGCLRSGTRRASGGGAERAVGVEELVARARSVPCIAASVCAACGALCYLPFEGSERCASVARYSSAADVDV